jgi:beta-glucosidase
MIKATFHFPRGFLWGTATSSHQVEGDCTNNDWWLWEQEGGRILHDHRSGSACEWWNGRWREDLEMAAKAGQNAHRLSIEWSRIEPRPGKWDQAAVDAYRQMIQGMRELGLTPMVTLHHFTNPSWVQEQEGWLNDVIVDWFERYVRVVVEALSDLVSLWVTINEPNVYAYMGYVEGVFPPGSKNLSQAFRVMHNMVLAHAAAYHTIHALQPQAQVGLAHHYRGMQPSNPRNPLDRSVAKVRSRLFNDLIPHALKQGRFRSPGRSVRMPQAAGTQDFFGLNYYTTETVAFDLKTPMQLFGRGYFPEDADLSPTGHIANRPEGMWEALRWAHKFDLPIYITENGVEDHTDRLRPRYLAMHIRQLWRAANFNWRLRGYFHWSLVDNFEWERGWTQRFGLWGLDTKTQERIRRPSADLYQEICRENGLSSEMVAQYAPEVFEALFPGKSSGEITAP